MGQRVSRAVTFKPLPESSHGQDDVCVRTGPKSLPPSDPVNPFMPIDLYNVVLILDKDNMDWLPQYNYHRAHYKDLDTPNLASV